MSVNLCLQVFADTFLVSVHGVHFQDMLVVSWKNRANYGTELDDQLGQHGNPQGGDSP